ncbi:macro domain-containing protein [Frankia sp. AgB32]|uniref:macro domain-containing protein n=1 Tax=Frankia sp. AgB32 TaxID=631119 RepID=UPI0020108033|nr:hypothetical protein [Frankia sp. AgB32]MCK9894008.1 hypothetical protein [Frankia sp. AgB32]
MNGRGKCFVISPYGQRTGTDGGVIDFDRLYEDVFAAAVGTMGFSAVRCDRIPQAGLIHRDMLRHIAVDDLAVVDITTANPNVFYELGVRHALKPTMTVITKMRGADVPFNIRDLRIIEYPGPDGSFEETRAEICRFIAFGIQSNEPDSPIYSLVQDAQRDWRRERITIQRKYAYQLVGQPDRRINLITGDIRHWRGIDVWVNSENTNLQMARFYDRSLSAMIRYEGARKDDDGQIIEDTVASELAAVLGTRASVNAGTVHATGSGELARARGVRKIFHAATVHGAPGGGYQVVNEVERCVTVALERMDSPRWRGENLRTIVFPMMGTGEGGGDVNLLAPRLLSAAISYFIANPDTLVTDVYFAAWNHRDLDACLSTLARTAEVEPTGS